MTSAKSVGRVIGSLLLIQLACGVLVYLVLLAPLTAPPGFLAGAAANSLRISVAALLWLFTGGLAVGISVVALPVFRLYSDRLALWLLALSVAALPLCAAESAAMLSLVSLSQAPTQAGGGDAELFAAVGTVAESAHKWAHYTYALVGSGVFVLLYGILHRFSLILRALAAVGLFAAWLHLAAVGMPFLGYDSSLVMQMPLALCNLAVALWLMAKGLGERPHLFRPEARAGGEHAGA